MTASPELREKVLRMVRHAPDSDAAYLQAADLLQAEGHALERLPALRLAVLRSFTIEPLAEVLKVKLFLEGYRLELFLGEFNQVEQEILSPSSRLHRFKPEVIFLAVRLEELAPRLLAEYPRLSPQELRQAQDEILTRVSGWVERIGEYSSSSVLLSNFLVPARGGQGICGTQTGEGHVSAVRALNAGLVRLRERFPALHLFDLEHLASRIGKDNFCDPLQMYRMSNPYRLGAYAAYGERILSHIGALRGQRRKCLVLDLDNTLWGGTVGEDGPGGVVLSDAYPGNCFKDFQKALLELSHRGILLAVNSKNNREEALEMFRSHPEMVLRVGDFSAMRINWEDKARNLREIALELNLGLDSLVFMDDSPAECERIRQACPEVLVVQLPGQKHLYRSTLEDLSCFEQLTLTEEDKARGKLYQERGRRQQLASECRTLEDFYASLEMRGALHKNNRLHIPRIAQMTQKTNQFNLTTRRWSEAEIARFMDQGAVYSLQIEDRFGDNGVVAVAVVTPRSDGREWAIDGFLMSCRVVMRTIEDTLLARVAEEAGAAGVRRLSGWYLPTPKNGMVKDFYPARGFEPRAADPSGGVEYVIELSGGAGELRPSPWIGLTREAEIRPSP